VFAATTGFDQHLMHRLAAAAATQLRAGALLITMSQPLPVTATSSKLFELMHQAKYRMSWGKKLCCLESAVVCMRLVG